MDQARKVLGRAIELAASYPDSPMAHARCAQAYEQVGEIEDAIRSATHSLNLIASQAGMRSLSGTAISCINLLISHRRFDIARACLRELPRTPALELLEAELLIHEDDIDRALVALKNQDENPNARSLLGYVHLVKGSPDQALREFRRAASGMSKPDAHIHKNMAICYWRMGAHNKAVKLAKVAAATAPGRRDIGNMLLDFLVDTGRSGEAKREIDRLKKLGVVEDASMLFVESSLAAKDGNKSKMRASLSRARIVAEIDGDALSAAIASANLQKLEFSENRASRTSTLRKIEGLFIDHPQSSAIFKMIADLSWTTRDLRVLERSLNLFKANRGATSTVAMGEAMVSNLRGDFDTAAEFSIEWMKLDPLNASAAGVAINLYGQTTEDWEHAAQLGRQALKVMPASEAVVNSAAYALALGGDAHMAIRTLRNFGTSSYVLKATLGLALLAAGDVSNGLAEYRKAADWADREQGEFHSRALMTLHQWAALKRLGIIDGEVSISVRAGALPPVDLPSAWHEFPAFSLLKWIADRNGWAWPLMVA